MSISDYKRFQNLTFEDFKELAKDDTLNSYEKIGFPTIYREEYEEKIFSDIRLKLKNLDQNGKMIMDIGPGCSGLALMLIELCRRNAHTLILIDSQEMLDQLPDESFIVKVPCFYPFECGWLFEKYADTLDAILTYSVLQYVFVESSLFDFVDKSLSLLADGGEMLIGDIPNISKRKRFFDSLNGIRFHQEFTGTQENPVVEFNKLESGQLDDAVLLSLLLRCRNSGFDAYLVPQSGDLPMANRREDILIRKP